MCTKKRTESDTPGHSKKTMKKKETRRQTYPTDQEKEREREKGKVLRHLEETIENFFLFNISHHSVYIY